MTDSSSLAKWSSVDLLAEEEPDTASPATVTIDKQGKYILINYSTI